MLKLEDFEKIFYYRYRINKEHELRLERCINGFCVALYRNDALIGEKSCTWTFDDIDNAILKALEIANQKLEELKNESKT